MAQHAATWFGAVVAARFRRWWTIALVFALLAGPVRGIDPAVLPAWAVP